MELFLRFNAFRYSMARILLGAERSSLSGKKAERAISLASGKFFPLFNSSRRSCRYSPGSSRRRAAAFSRGASFPSSLPKQRVSTTPEASRSSTAPSAKYSALPVAAAAGSSRTRSAPFLRAISARAYLSTMAGSPRCMKFPPMTTRSRSAPVSSRALAR